MKKFLWATVCAAGLFTTGCGGPAHPDEAEVKATVTGAYCTDNARYNVTLTMDGRYTARRNSMGAFATGFIGEKCAGKYLLAYDDDKLVWNLQFEKADENSNPFVKCAGHSVVVWEHEKGYAKIDSVMRITDPFEQNELKKDCGGSL
jgi:hypothetical protein